MSTRIETGDGSLTIIFERNVTKAFSELLHRSQSGICRIAVPFKADVYVDALLTDVTINPPQPGKDYVYAEWSVRVSSTKLKDFKDEEGNIIIPPTTCYVMGGVVQFKPSFELRRIQDCNVPTEYEHFSEVPVIPVDKAAPNWDHRYTIQEILLDRKEPVLIGPAVDGQTEGGEGEYTILIPMGNDRRSGKPNYTQLGLSKDGWTYEADMTSEESYPEASVEDAIKMVCDSALAAIANP